MLRVQRGRKAIKVYRAHGVLWAAWDRLVLQGRKDPPALAALQGFKDPVVLQGQPDLAVQQGHEVKSARLVLQDRRVVPGHPARKDHKVTPVDKAPPARRVHPDHPDHPDHQGRIAERGFT